MGVKPAVVKSCKNHSVVEFHGCTTLCFLVIPALCRNPLLKFKIKGCRNKSGMTLSSESAENRSVVHPILKDVARTYFGSLSHYFVAPVVIGQAHLLSKRQRKWGFANAAISWNNYLSSLKNYRHCERGPASPCLPAGREAIPNWLSGDCLSAEASAQAGFGNSLRTMLLFPRNDALI